MIESNHFNREHTPICESLDVYLLQELGEQENEAFEIHLSNCHACRSAVEQTQRIESNLRLAQKSIVVPDELEKSIRSQFSLSRVELARAQTTLPHEHSSSHRSAIWLASLAIAASILLIFLAIDQARNRVGRSESTVSKRPFGPVDRVELAPKVEPVSAPNALTPEPGFLSAKLASDDPSFEIYLVLPIANR